MKRSLKKIVLVILLLVTIVIPNMVFAIDTDPYKGIYNDTKTPEMDGFMGNLLGTVQVVSGFTLLISLITLGVQFMLGAPEGKSEAKKRVITIVIGTFLVFSASTVVSIIANVANKL